MENLFLKMWFYNGSGFFFFFFHFTKDIHFPFTLFTRRRTVCKLFFIFSEKYILSNIEVISIKRVKKKNVLWVRRWKNIRDTTLSLLLKLFTYYRL